jgi:hypothetical protein
MDIKINDNERKVLEQLVEAYDPDEWGAYAFRSLANQTKLDIPQVRRACRSLARKGLAAYERTLWNDDGPAGAGYRATEEGAAFILPCDLCGKRASFDFLVNDKGEQVVLPQEGLRRVRECRAHEEQSPNRKQLANNLSLTL